MPDTSYALAWDALCVESGLGFERHDIAVVGTTTRVYVVGDGPDVVLIPGAGASLASWVPLAAHLPDHRLYLVELPGVGFGGPFSWDQGDLQAHATGLVDDILRGLRLSSSSLVGNSFGGWIVVAWALSTRPANCPIAVAGLAPGLQEGPIPIRTALRGLEAHGVGDGPLHAELSARAGPPPRLFAEPGRISPAYRDLEKALWASPQTRETWASILRAMLTADGEMAPSLDLTSQLAETEMPFTYALGTEDPYLNLLDPRPHRVPGADLIAIPGAGHLPWFERGRALARIIASTAISGT